MKTGVVYRISLPSWILSIQLAITLLGGSVLGQPATVLAVVGGQVVDGTPGPPIPDGVVVIRGNQITAVGPRSAVSIPPEARIIDAGGNTVLPGLADLHTHTTFFRANPAEFEDDSLAGLRAAAILRQALDAGITLVRDVGARHLVAIGLKRAIEKGYLEGPRLVVCNNIVGITGSHGSKFELMLPPKILLESDSPAEWRKHIRHNLKMGADFIMVAPPYTLEEIKIAAEEAHRFGVRIGAEAAGYVVGPPAQIGSYPYPGTMTVEYAVRARIDTLEHLYPVRNEARVLALMRENKTIVVPTLAATQRLAGDRWTTPTAEDRRWEITAHDYEARFRRLHAAGVPMALGTDTIGSHQGQIGTFYQRELELFGQWGYSAHETLQAATRIGAEAAGYGDTLGTLEPGKLADLIVVPGNALEDVRLVIRPLLVIKDGIIVRDLTDCGSRR